MPDYLNLNKGLFLFLFMSTVLSVQTMNIVIKIFFPIVYAMRRYNYAHYY